MKRGLTVVLAVALAVVLLVPAAGAKPGNGNGHGPPAWAGGGGGGGGGGKPAWAGHQGGKADKAERKAEKAEWKAERKAAREGAAAGPKHMNPAWICKFERDQDAGAFIEKYGENENGANAFGKCVSRAAHDRDGVTEAEEGTPTSDDEETSDPGDSTDEEPEESALPASVQAFLHSLWPFFF